MADGSCKGTMKGANTLGDRDPNTVSIGISENEDKLQIHATGDVIQT